MMPSSCSTEFLRCRYREQAHSYKELMSITSFKLTSDTVGVSLLAIAAGRNTTDLRMNATCLRHDVVSYAIQNPLG